MFRKRYITGIDVGISAIKIAQFLYTKENLCIDKSLLENDLYVLKSKQQVPFLYAGFYAEAHNIPVIPNPDISYKHKNRLEAYLLIKNAGLLYHNYIMEHHMQLKRILKRKIFP